MFNTQNWDDVKKALVEGLSSPPPGVQAALDSQAKAMGKANANVAEFRKVMMPMIRRIIPGIIASDIIGGSTRKVTMEFPEGLKVNVTAPTRHIAIQIQEWLRDTIGEKCYTITTHEYYLSEFTVYFTDESDMMALKLTWDNFQAM